MGAKRCQLLLEEHPNLILWKLSCKGQLYSKISEYFVPNIKLQILTILTNFGSTFHYLIGVRLQTSCETLVNPLIHVNKLWTYMLTFAPISYWKISSVKRKFEVKDCSIDYTYRFISWIIKSKINLLRAIEVCKKIKIPPHDLASWSWPLFFRIVLSYFITWSTIFILIYNGFDWLEFFQNIH